MRRARFLRVAAACALMILGVVWSLRSDAQSQISPADPKIPDEIILARQGLMESVSGLMNEGEAPDTPAEAATMRANAEAVALSLPALKFLFPPETNPQHAKFASSFKTYALPSIWENFEKFSHYLDETVAVAHALDQARNPVQVSILARRLLEACEACHTEFREPYKSPFDAQ